MGRGMRVPLGTEPRTHKHPHHQIHSCVSNINHIPMPIDFFIQLEAVIGTGVGGEIEKLPQRDVIPTPPSTHRLRITNCQDRERGRRAVKKEDS